MSGAGRRRVMLGITLAVVLWPIVHLGLVARADIDAWELFGWAMYSRPEARVQVRVDVERAGAREPLRAMGDLRRRVEQYARARTTLGRLASPESLLEAVFASDPSIEAIVIVLRTIELDRGTAMLLSHDEPERHLRSISTPSAASRSVQRPFSR